MEYGHVDGMDEENGRIYVWAETSTAAREKVERATGIKGLVAKLTGLTRPGGYEFTGTIQEDNVVEHVGQTVQRYVVAPRRKKSTFNIDEALAERAIRREA